MKNQLYGKNLFPEGKRFLTAVLFISFIFWNSCSHSTQETRALWVVRDALISPKSVAQMINDAVQGGFNTLLVQVRGRGDAFYQSTLIPRTRQLSQQRAEFDPLEMTIELAKKHNLRIHAWINLLLVSSLSQVPQSKKHVALQHPDWILTPTDLIKNTRDSPTGNLRKLSLLIQYFRQKKTTEGLFLDPAIPQVQNHLLNMISELISNYSLDGIHLDYVRYPGSDPAYSLGSISQFARSVSGDNFGRQGLSMEESLDISRKSQQKWNQFRRDKVTQLVSKIHAMVRQSDPKMILSAAVVADSKRAYGSLFQDWEKWLKAGILDVVCPMSYTPQSTVFKDRIQMAKKTSSQAQVWAGIGAYKLDGLGIIEQIKISRSLGTHGFVVFSYNTLIASTKSRRSLWEPLVGFLKSPSTKPLI